MQNTRGIVQITGGTNSYNGTLVAYVDYDSFGSPITQSGGSTVSGGLTATTGGYAYSVTPIAFGTSYSDVSGLDYLLNRYIDPASAQFVSVDRSRNKRRSPSRTRQTTL